MATLTELWHATVVRLQGAEHIPRMIEHDPSSPAAKASFGLQDIERLLRENKAMRRRLRAIAELVREFGEEK